MGEMKINKLKHQTLIR